MTKVFLTSGGIISSELQEHLYGYDFHVGSREDTDITGYDIIVHTAGNKDIASTNPYESVRDNVLSTHKYVEQLTDSQQFILLSSLSVGDIKNVYSATKFLSEEVTKKAPNWAILRLGTVLSSGCTFIRWVDQARNGEKIKVTDVQCERCVTPLDKTVSDIIDTFNFSGANCIYEPRTVQFSIRNILRGIGLYLDRQVLYEEVGLPPHENLFIDSNNSTPGLPSDFKDLLNDFYNS